MTYLEDIKTLIEKDIVLQRKNRIYEENHRVNTYFEIGRLIVEAQGGEARAKYGNGLIKEWSKVLTDEYGKGYDVSNLKRMRKLYLTFQKGGPLGHLSWSHYRYILPIKEESKRNYYINLCIIQNLTKNQLIEKIKNKEYERLEFKDNIKIISDNYELTIKDMIKNPVYIKIDKKVDKLNEQALKQFILDKTEEFLLELGVGFTYVGSEVKLGKFYCDLLFFNYELNCFVVIEIKIRKLRPQDMGQIKHYMNYIDMNMKKDYMNETIGVIMCKENGEIVVKYVTDEGILMTTYNLTN